VTIAVRPYQHADAEAAVAFFADAGQADATLHPPSSEDWHEFTTRTQNHDARDFALAVESGRIVALLTSTRHEHLDPPLRHFRIVVHPDRRRRGIGTALLRHVETQDEDAILQCNCSGAWKAGAAFLAAAGFEPWRRALEMERAAPAPPLEHPGGYVIRAAEKTDADDAAWRRLNDAGYRGDPGWSELTPRDQRRMRAMPGFRLWLAERDGAAVGLCNVVPYAGDFWINSVVVDRAHRGRGLGRALTITALQAGGPMKLSVLADNAPALAIYCKLGFETTDEMTTWRRPR